MIQHTPVGRNLRYSPCCLANGFNVTAAKLPVGALRGHCWPQRSPCTSDVRGFVTFPFNSNPFLAFVGVFTAHGRFSEEHVSAGSPSARGISGNGLCTAGGSVCPSGGRWVHACRVQLQSAPARSSPGCAGGAVVRLGRS